MIVDDRRCAARSLQRHVESALRERLRYRTGATPPPGTRPREPVERELSLAKANTGPTVFDWLVEIIRSHPDVPLVLD